MAEEALESSRLVFVSLRDAKPKRKVAVPIPQGLTWIEFLRTVESKLKLSTGIRDVILASTGETVTSLDQLQDIDELFVVEAPQTPAAVSNGNAFATSSNQGQQQRLGTVDSEISPQLNSELENDADGHAKYVKRQTSVQRTLRRVFPSLFAQSSLPVTTKDTTTLSPVEQIRRRVKRRRRSAADPRMVLTAFLILCVIGTLGFVYLRAIQGLIPQ